MSLKVKLNVGEESRIREVGEGVEDDIAT